MQQAIRPMCCLGSPAGHCLQVAISGPNAAQILHPELTCRRKIPLTVAYAPESGCRGPYTLGSKFASQTFAAMLDPRQPLIAPSDISGHYQQCRQNRILTMKNRRLHVGRPCTRAYIWTSSSPCQTETQQQQNAMLGPGTNFKGGIEREQKQRPLPGAWIRRKG